jgi:hypothetical protein
MRGGIIKVEEIGGVAYTLTTLSPENGGGFNITGATGVEDVKGESGNVKCEIGEVKTVYDLQGRKVDTPSKSIYIINGKKVIIK